MKRIRGLSGIWAGALLFTVATSSSAQNLRREVSGWYNDGWNTESHAAYMANSHVFSEVNPYWYDLGTTQNQAATDGSVSERGYAFSAQNVTDAHANGDLVIPAIADHGPAQIDAIVTNPSARGALVSNLTSLVNARGYDGIDLNFERGTSNARAAFTTFTGELAAALHATGKRLVVTVSAATSAREEGRYIFDYAALAAAGVDRLKIMAYDHNFDAGANVPGPIAPIPWVRSVLSYFITERGVPSNRIQLGIHNYGWTWRKTAKAWQILSPHDTFRDVELKSGNATWLWDATAQESWKDYLYGGKSYRSFVGTSDTVAPRAALADEFDLAGISFWVLGREDNRTYPQLCTRWGTNCMPPPTLLSQGRPATSSSAFDAYYTASRAFDGNIVDGWLAAATDPNPWLRVDLGAPANVTQVKIFWGNTDWALSYDVQTSNDASAWTTVYHEANNPDGGLDTINLTGASGRYVRLVCSGPKSDGWSYEVYELQVVGRP